MQNRFTVKDFFYMLIGAVVCLLLFFNMIKTDREVEAITEVDNTLRSQQTTLSNLGNAVDKLGNGQTLDAATLQRLAESMSARTQGSPNGTSTGANSSPMATSQGNGQGSPSSDRPINLAEPPSFKSGYNNQFAIWTDSVNLLGLPQQWQTAPDEALPEDFAAGDTLVRVWQTDAQKLTPLVATDAYSRRVFWYTSEYLVNFNLDVPFGLRPGLAESWEVSDDGMELTFHLHENATWSDGKPVTADDVIFTWDTVLNEKMDTSRIRGYLTDNVADYEKIDRHTVRFTMKRTYFDAVGICGQLLFIVPKHIYEDYDPETFNNDIPDVLVGSGPYVLESWEKNTQITLARNENYWGPKAPLEKIIIRINSNELARLQEFKAGNVDMIDPTPEQWTQNVDSDWFRESNDEPMLYYSPRGGYSYIGYNLRKPHFSDKRTRQALTMLIDRQAFIDTLIEGLGVIISGPFYFKSDQYNDDVEPWPYDPQRARELLREVGWEDSDNDGVLDMDLDGDGVRDPFEVTYLLPSGSSLGTKIQRFVQQSFREAGISLNLDRLEWSVFLERLHERQFDMVTLSWTGDTETDPYQIWHSDSIKNRGSNHVGFNNERADELIEAGRTTLDRDKRMQIWHEFHEVIHEQQPYTFLYGRSNRHFIDYRFKNDEKRDYRPFYAEWYVPSEMQVR